VRSRQPRNSKISMCGKRTLPLSSSTRMPTCRDDDRTSCLDPCARRNRRHRAGGITQILQGNLHSADASGCRAPALDPQIKEQLFAVYKQAYSLAYDMAKKAEKAYKFEMGIETASFIQYGYRDNSKQGLVSGEMLQLALRQLEKAYLEENRREFELTKSVSLARLDPLALIQLRETGKCYVSLPEELFDLDFRGHYFRCLKGVQLFIPCVVGPLTPVPCSLRLLKNTIRINTAMNSSGNYEHENDEGIWIDDDRFRTAHVPVTGIATSTGQSDSGMFEFNFCDEPRPQQRLSRR
jgi:hypothetical protein